MKIDYILSDSTKSATTETLKKVAELSQENILENFVVLVPETKSIIIEKELLALSKRGAVANVFVYSFVRLLGRLDFVQKDKIISKQTAVMLIRKIIYDNFDKLVCYKKTAKNINFAEKIYDTLQQLKSSNVSVEDLKTAALASDSALKAKLEDIAFLFEEYEKLLGGTLFDDCDKLNLLKQFARTNEFIQNAHVFVVGFDNVTPEMISVLEEIAKNAKSITFSSVYFAENRKDKYIQKNDLYLKFRRVADNLKYPYKPKFIASRRKGDFYSIANNLFIPNLKEGKYSGDVKIFAAPNKLQEIRFVANKIIELVKAGARFKDIGVLALDIENDKKYICEIFDELGINYFVNQEISVANHALLLLIKNCFEIYLSHLSAEKVLKFLKSHFVKMECVFEFENFVKEYGLNYNDFANEFGVEFKEKRSDFEKMAKIMHEFQCFYRKFAEKLKNAKTANDFLSAVKFVIEYFNAEKVLQEIADFELKCGMRENSSVTLAMLGKVNEFMQMLGNFMGEMQMTADEFLQVFMSGFSTVKINLAPVSVDCVVVQSDTDGFFNIKNLFIVSADEDHFPPAIQDMGIILDDELEKTNLLCGKEIEPTTKDINAREKFIAYESLLEPTEKLFISFSKFSIDGSAKKPSNILQKLAVLFGKSAMVENFKQSSFVSIENLKTAFAQHIGTSLTEQASENDLGGEYAILKNHLSENFENHLNALQLEKQNFYIDNAAEIYFTNGKTSASQLENYFSCPYNFFVNYGLRLKENKVAKLSKLDIGVVLHRVAEVFVKNISKFLGLDDVALTAKIEALVKKVFEDLNLKQQNNKAAISFLFDESKRLCKYLLREQNASSFKAKFSEFSFRGDTGVKLKLASGDEIFLEGKIDRIDEFGDYIRIIDYKTGDIESDLFSVFYGKKIQLVSYLLAISDSKNKKIAGILYLPIHSDFAKNAENNAKKYKMNGFLLKDMEVLKHMDSSLSFENPKSDFIPVTIKTSAEIIKKNIFDISRPGQKFLTEKEFELLKNYSEKLFEKAAEEIWEGYIEPSPFKKGDDDDSMPCRWCEFAGFCGLENATFSNGRKCNSGIEIESFKPKEEN